METGSKTLICRNVTLGNLSQSADELTFGEETLENNNNDQEQDIILEESKKFWACSALEMGTKFNLS